MLVFVDESGNAYPSDPATRPVCVGVCIEEDKSRYISGRLHTLKRDLVKKEEMEFKANRLLNRSTFRRIPEKRELVEAFFDLMRNLPIAIFAVIMERPLSLIPKSIFLPNQFRYLLQRCDLLVSDTDDMVTVLFDGDCRQHDNLSLKFSAFLYRSSEGRSMTRITDTPFFVDSRVTAGIQIADMAASVIRIYEEQRLFQGVPIGDSFLYAINRYYGILEERTKNQTSSEGYPRAGFYRMPERDHYSAITADQAQENVPQNEPNKDVTKPESQQQHSQSVTPGSLD